MLKGILLNIGIIFLEIQLIIIPYIAILLLFFYIIFSIPHLTFLPNNNLVYIFINVTVVVILIVLTLAFIYYPFHVFARTKIKQRKFRNLIKWHIYADKVGEKITIFRFLLFAYVIIILSIAVGYFINYFNLLPAP